LLIDSFNFFLPVNGEWAPWGSFGKCTKSCGGGYRERHRSCTAPSPKYGGRSCIGHPRHIAYCNYHQCKGIIEYCKMYKNLNWNPFKIECFKCFLSLYLYFFFPVNGNWGSWSSYGECSAYCDGGIKKRYRYCNSPAPAHGGQKCNGNDEQSSNCNTHRCPST